MSFKDRLINNRRALGIPDPESFSLVQLEPVEVAKILTSTMALLDAIEYLSSYSSATEVAAIKKLAGKAEQSIASAVLNREGKDTPQKTDRDFLVELRMRVEQGILGDTTQQEYAFNMIDHWIDELTEIVNLGSAARAEEKL